MKHKETIADKFESLAQVRAAVDAMVLALIIAIISIAGEHEGCSLTFQKALLQGSMVLFVGALLLVFIAMRSEMAVALAFITRCFVSLIKRRSRGQPQTQSKDT